MAESAYDKARRYLTEGRLRVMVMEPARIVAVCRGDGETYVCGFTRNRWSCQCPARTIDCAHLRALRLVVDRPNA